MRTQKVATAVYFAALRPIRIVRCLLPPSATTKAVGVISVATLTLSPQNHKPAR